MKILITGGARPNFMKIAPIIRAIKKYDDIEFKLVHTGQHYDHQMSEVFFEEFELSKPDYYLGVGSGEHGEQTGKIMIEFEKICKKENPDVVIVIGDVNSTMACALVSSKLHIKTAHIEAGLRSYDMKMPEEINRIVSDICSDYLFCTIREAEFNLTAEGIDTNRIFIVGDTMIDNLLYYSDKAKKIDNQYDILLTLHRPSNVDDKETLQSILEAIKHLSLKYNVRFPMHPRTEKMIEKFDFNHYIENCLKSNPVSYIELVSIMKSSKLILTDSGGIQIEAALLKTPCITLRDTTEQIDTVFHGHNILVGSDTFKIIEESELRIEKDLKLTDIKDDLRDGNAAKRIIEILREKLNKII